MAHPHSGQLAELDGLDEHPAALIETTMAWSAPTRWVQWFLNGKWKLEEARGRPYGFLQLPERRLSEVGVSFCFQVTAIE